VIRFASSPGSLVRSAARADSPHEARNSATERFVPLRRGPTATRLTRPEEVRPPQLVDGRYHLAVGQSPVAPNRTKQHGSGTRSRRALTEGLIRVRAMPAARGRKSPPQLAGVLGRHRRNGRAIGYRPAVSVVWPVGADRTGAHPVVTCFTGWPPTRCAAPAPCLELSSCRDRKRFSSRGVMTVPDVLVDRLLHGPSLAGVRRPSPQVRSGLVLREGRGGQLEQPGSARPIRGSTGRRMAPGPA